jgi:hypothetical protein
MIHKDLVDQIILQQLKQGDLVEIKLTSGDLVTGRLSFGKVVAHENENGEIVDSRIGLLPPPPPNGKIYSQIVTTVYSVNIETINKL